MKVYELNGETLSVREKKRLLPLTATSVPSDHADRILVHSPIVLRSPPAFSMQSTMHTPAHASVLGGSLGPQVSRQVASTGTFV